MDNGLHPHFVLIEGIIFFGKCYTEGIYFDFESYEIFFSKYQFCPFTFLSDQSIRLINKKSNKGNN